MRKRTRKKQTTRTQRNRIVWAIRKLWLYSKERNAVIRRANGCCENCGEETKSLQVHHVDGIDWEKIVDYIQNRILCNPDRLLALCKKCHQQIHKEG